MIDGTNPVRAWLGTGGTLTFAVVSGSMAPTILPGDSIDIAAAERLRVGDVALLEREHIYVVHRIVRTWPHIRTRGDAVVAIDPPVTRDDVLGTVRAVWRDGTRRPLSPYPASLWYVFARPPYLAFCRAAGKVKRTVFSVSRGP